MNGLDPEEEPSETNEEIRERVHRLDAPNACGAVMDSLPTLCSILLSFVSAYFVAVTLSDSEIVKSVYFIKTVEDVYCAPIWLTHRLFIQSSSFLASMLFFISLINAFNVKAYTFDKDNYPEEEEPPLDHKIEWMDKRKVAVGKAYKFFNRAMPFLAISIVGLLNSWFLLLTLLILIIVFFCYR